MAQKSVAVALQQDGLHPHAGGGQFVPQRLAERQHEGLAAAIDAVQQFRRDGHDGRDVDDRAPAARATKAGATA